MTGAFSSVLKSAIVLTIFKNDSKLDNSKLDYSSYRPISLFLNIQKLLEKRMYKRLYPFINNNNVIYSLQFGFYSIDFIFILLSFDFILHRIP